MIGLCCLDLDYLGTLKRTSFLSSALFDLTSLAKSKFPGVRRETEVLQAAPLEPSLMSDHTA